jgi:hypothetical protein
VGPGFELIARGSSNGKANDRRPSGPDAAPGEANMIAIIAIGWLAAVWAIVLLFSIYFSQNMK